MKTPPIKSFRNYSFEFLSIFIAVVSAFALNNWNDERKAKLAERKILMEIRNGLELDLRDIEENVQGHQHGRRAAHYMLDLVHGNQVDLDSFNLYMFYLVRDFVTLQNASGYETLKARGLELIEDDSLRYSIIRNYSYNYTMLRKLEESYEENQFYKNYFPDISRIFTPHLEYTKPDSLPSLRMPLELSDEDRTRLSGHFQRIAFNRNFLLGYYAQVQSEVKSLQEQIDQVLEE